MKVKLILTACLYVLAICPVFAQSDHGIAMHGKVKYAADFKHLDYVNPAAPKGGRIVLGRLGSFDSLNPFIVKGSAGPGLRDYVFESLMGRAYDEPFSLYGLLAESIETADDRSWVIFRLRREARFSDGKPVSPDDVIFSHALLRDKGRPNHRSHYAKVSRVEKIGERGVKFTFGPGGDREMPLIMGLMPILPRHVFSAETFEKTSLSPPIGSGPYLVDKVDAGKTLSYKRNPDYWGRNLAINRGRYNFDEVRYDFYRDSNSMFEAFKKGLIHLRLEYDPAQWTKAYDFPARRQGRVVREEIDLQRPSGMAALVFNTRRKLFSDIRVRKALALMLDFEWINKNLFHSKYSRTASYFDRSELASSGRPADEREIQLLSPFPGAVDADILAGAWTPPKSDGSGRDRRNRRKALRLLGRAGYELKGPRLIERATGKPFVFEILAASRRQERLLLTFATALKRIGISARVRQVDSAQYQRRLTGFDFDMIQYTWFASLSPGNEQIHRWNTKYAGQDGSFNFAGVKNPAADKMIEALLQVRDRTAFVSAVRALDRVLLSGHYVIPLFHLPKQWVAYWRQLKHPKNMSLYGLRLNSWWADPESGIR